MTRRQLFEGPFQGVPTNLLPPEFDPQAVASFFAASRQNDAARENARSWADTDSPDEAGWQGRPFDGDWPGARPEPAGADDDGTDGPTDAAPLFTEGGGAKPAHANGGRNTDSTDTSDSTDTAASKPGKGNGRDKTKDETDTTDPTDSTDTTDTGNAEGTTGSGETVPEENTGSTDPDTYVSGLDTPYGYNIEISFVGSWTKELKQGVYAAAETISDIIVGDLPEHNGIDDLRIEAALDDLAGYWGWGVVTSVRDDSFLPSQGYFLLDPSGAQTALNNGIYEDLVLHEMLHTLGFGVAWSAMDLVTDYGGDLRFTGENATEAYNSYYADIAAADALSDLGVPVETDGGNGTAGVHWDDATFTNEIMTGQLNSGNAVSDMTVAALEDMGYDTIYGDSFVFA